MSYNDQQFYLFCEIPAAEEENAVYLRWLFHGQGV